MIEIIIFALIYFSLDALHDKYVIKWKQTGDKKASGLWHTIDAIIKGFVIGYIVYLSFGISVLGGLIWLLVMCLRWIWFDGLLNLLRGKSFFYVGKTAKLDKMFKGKLQFAIKGIILVGITILLIFIK